MSTNKLNIQEFKLLKMKVEAKYSKELEADKSHQEKFRLSAMYDLQGNKSSYTLAHYMVKNDKIIECIFKYKKDYLTQDIESKTKENGLSKQQLSFCKEHIRSAFLYTKEKEFNKPEKDKVSISNYYRELFDIYLSDVPTNDVFYKCYYFSTREKALVVKNFELTFNLLTQKAKVKGFHEDTNDEYETDRISIQDRIMYMNLIKVIIT